MVPVMGTTKEIDWIPSDWMLVAFYYLPVLHLRVFEFRNSCSRQRVLWTVILMFWILILFVSLHDQSLYCRCKAFHAKLLTFSLLLIGGDPRFRCASRPFHESVA